MNQNSNNRLSVFISIDGRTYRSLTAEYGVSKASICKWCKEFSEECRKNASKNPTAQNDLELMKENRRLREELAEAKKENLFLKKRQHSSQRESTRGLPIHRRISGSVWCSVTAATFGNLSSRVSRRGVSLPHCGTFCLCHIQPCTTAFL